MIKITIPKTGEMYNELTGEFFCPVEKELHLQLEHSLISLQNWEKKWHKPFLDKSEKSLEETLDYIRCMTLNPEIDPKVYKYIPKSEIERVKAYIDDPMSATWFNEKNASVAGKGGKREVITAEIIYYWMITFQIPPEYRKWHLNQLITLIRVMSIKNTPSKKMSKREILSQNAQLNAARKAKYHTKG